MPVLKTGVAKATVGSNPTLSAKIMSSPLGGLIILTWGGFEREPAAARWRMKAGEHGVIVPIGRGANPTLSAKKTSSPLGGLVFFGIGGFEREPAAAGGG